MEQSKKATTSKVLQVSSGKRRRVCLMDSPSHREDDHSDTFLRNQLIGAMIDNSINSMVEKLQCNVIVENEAVAMAIRSHGLRSNLPSKIVDCAVVLGGQMNSSRLKPTVNTNVVNAPECDTPEKKERIPPGDEYIVQEIRVLDGPPSCAFSSSPSTSRQTVLSEALSAAFRNKGLGAASQ